MTTVSIAAALLVSTVVMAAAQTPPQEPPVVVAQGEGVVRRAPDQALVRIGAESRARTPKEAQGANAEAMTAVQQRLTAAGVPKDAIRTVVVSLQQEFDYKDGRQTLRGYLARNVIEVRVDDLSRLGEVLDATVAAGATSIQSLRFDLKERAAAEREALASAVADGMARAEAAAKGAGRTIERVVRIEESGPPSIIRPQGAESFARMAADAPPTPIAEGEIEIRARVSVTAAMK